MPFEPQQVKRIFQSAIKISGSTRRAEYLSQVCAESPALRSRVEELLRAHEWPSVREAETAPPSPESSGTVELVSTQGFEQTSLESPGTESTTAADQATGRVGGIATSPQSRLSQELIAGRYRLRESIGEGGMGTVYLAEQVQPVRREVALKLVRSEMDSERILSRFENERQALAMMDHPNIARVLDAGTTAEGRPFFVMELVRGRPITEYCELHGLGLPERLNLMRQVCMAVQHAHQKGIIHRDLKPSNILVESHDAIAVPKVIDFGLAKATGGVVLSDQSLHTAFGAIAGTPLYMAPEQAMFNAIDVDTRADVYALGVVLYELLTGTTPISRELLRKAALDEVFRLVRENEPLTPSSQIGMSHVQAGTSPARRTEPHWPSRLVRGELDWITMKALAKERHRRYESPSALGRDIERYLNHEPVSAGPPSALYRLRKLARRHRVAVGAVSLMLLALFIGTIGTTLGLIEARKQKAKAETAATNQLMARKEEAKQRKIAEQERQHAEWRLDQVEKANQLLAAVFRDLDPTEQEASGRPLRAVLGERLNHAARSVEDDSLGDPRTTARIQVVLGQAQQGLGYTREAVETHRKAMTILERELGPDHAETLSSVLDLAEALEAAGQWKDASPLLARVASSRGGRRDSQSPESVRVMSELALLHLNAGRMLEAMPLLEQVLTLYRTSLGDDHIDTLRSMGNLGVAYLQAGKASESASLLKRAVAGLRGKSQGDLTDMPVFMSNLGAAYYRLGQFRESVAVNERALALAKERLGVDHPVCLNTMNNLAQGYQATGRLAEAVSLQEGVLQYQKLRLGAKHPETLRSLHNLASSYTEMGRISESIEMHQAAVAGFVEVCGEDHIETLGARHNLASAWMKSGQMNEAQSLLEELAPRAQASLGNHHPLTLRIRNSQGVCLWRLGRLDRSIPLFEELAEMYEHELGPDHIDIWNTRANLGVNYLQAGRKAEAIPILEAAFQVSKNSPRLGWVVGPLHHALSEAERYEEAASITEDLLAQARGDLAAGGLELAGLLSHAGSVCLKAGQPDQAVPLLWESMTIRESKAPGSWTVDDARSSLGEAFLKDGRIEEAGPLIRSGYEGLKERSEEIPDAMRSDRLILAIDRWIAWAEAAGRDEEAESKRAERAKLQDGSTTSLAPGCEVDDEG